MEPPVRDGAVEPAKLPQRERERRQQRKPYGPSLSAEQADEVKRGKV
jgi:hypothetical protein